MTYYDDSFRERDFVPEEQVEQICKIKSKAEVLNLAGFGEPMSEWATKAEELGQTIIPRTVYVTQVYEQYEHRVAWVYHSWRKPDEIEELHHIACDCVGFMEDPDEQIHEIAECPAVLAAVEYRADKVAEILMTREILHNFGKPEQKTTIEPTRIVTAKAVINFAMNYDQVHPEGWIANMVSGEHQIPLLALLMQVEAYKSDEDSERLSVQEIVEEMDEDGSLVLLEDGITVTLPQAA